MAALMSWTMRSANCLWKADEKQPNGSARGGLKKEGAMLWTG